MKTTVLSRGVVAAIMCASGVMALGVAVPATADEPATPTQTVLAERSNPATQLVLTEYKAKVSARGIDLNSRGIALFRLAAIKAQLGELTSLSDVVEYLFTRIRRSPGAYLRGVGPREVKTLTLSTVGSGFFVTPDGYLVTARHVVTADKALKDSFARQGAAAFAKSESKSFIRLFSEWDPSDEAIQAIRDSVSAFMLSEVKVKVAAPKVSVVLGVADTGGGRVGKAQRAEVTYRSAADLGEDIAILHMRGFRNLPTLPLASSPPTMGSEIYLVGFPASATFIEGMSEAAQLQPTMTQGRINAVKPTEGGVQLLQTGANALPGSSGGAALDGSGNVVGVLVSGAVDDDGKSVGENFVMPVDVLADALRTANVTPATSLTSQTYDQALGAYSEHYYKRALPLFQQVKDLFPAHAYVSKYISDSQTAITQGKDETPSSTMTLILIGVAVLVILLIAAAALLLLRRRRRGRGPGQAPATADGGPAAGSVEPPWVPVGVAPDNGSDTEPPSTPPAQPQYPPTADVPLQSALGEQRQPDGWDTGDAGAESPDGDVIELPDAIPEWQPIGYVPAVPPPPARGDED